MCSKFVGRCLLEDMKKLIYIVSMAGLLQTALNIYLTNEDFKKKVLKFQEKENSVFELFRNARDENKLTDDINDK
jgi:hypothetical protein